jgi:hypothetical protein
MYYAYLPCMYACIHTHTHTHTGPVTPGPLSRAVAFALLARMCSLSNAWRVLSMCSLYHALSLEYVLSNNVFSLECVLSYNVFSLECVLPRMCSVGFT